MDAQTKNKRAKYNNNIKLFVFILVGIAIGSYVWSGTNWSLWPGLLIFIGAGILFALFSAFVGGDKWIEDDDNVDLSVSVLHEESIVKFYQRADRARLLKSKKINRNR